jgi:hypothetical protein
MDDVLGKLIKRMRKRSEEPPPDLLIWRGAAWIRAGGGSALGSGSDALRICLERIEEIRDSVKTAATSSTDTPLLKLGLAYVLFHCWKRVDAERFQGDPERESLHLSWVEESLALAEQARVELPRNELSWGLAVNHCVYVGMEMGCDTELVMDHMQELMQLEAYGIWTARFADTVACYYMWRFEQEIGKATDANIGSLERYLDMATEYLRFARNNAIGDIATKEHEIRCDRLRVVLRRIHSSEP